MTKEEFFDFAKKLDKFVSEGDKLMRNPALNTDLMIDYSGFGWESLEVILTIIFGKEGTDWIYWWYFERPKLKNKERAFDQFGLVIPTETLDDLWNILKDHIK